MWYFFTINVEIKSKFEIGIDVVSIEGIVLKLCSC